MRSIDGGKRQINQQKIALRMKIGVFCASAAGFAPRLSLAWHFVKQSHYVFFSGINCEKTFRQHSSLIEV